MELKTADDERISVYIQELTLLRNELRSAIDYNMGTGGYTGGDDSALEADEAYLSKVDDAIEMLRMLLPKAEPA